MFFENLFAAKGLTKIWVEKIELKEKKNTAAFYLFSREIIDFKAIDDIEDEIKNRYENAVNIEIHIRYELKEVYIGRCPGSCHSRHIFGRRVQGGRKVCIG
jgi:hypothetical protein